MLSRASASSARPAPSATVTLRLLARARLRRRPRVRVGAVGRQRRLDGGLVGRGGDAGGARRAATSTSRSSPSARRRRASSCRTRCAAARSRRQVVGVPARAGRSRSSCPEVNGDRALEHDGIVANPNCCTIPLTCVLKPLHDAAGLRARARRDVPVGLGRRRAADGAAARRGARRARPRAWTGASTARSSTRRRSSAPRRARSSSCRSCPISATCVRVPVLVGHAEAVWVETEEPLSRRRRRRELLAAAPSVRLDDVPDARRRRRGTDEVLVGRIRRDRAARERPRALPRLRQPAQGRGAERDPDRRAASSRRYASRSALRSPPYGAWLGESPRTLRYGRALRRRRRNEGLAHDAQHASRACLRRPARGRRARGARARRGPASRTRDGSRSRRGSRAGRSSCARGSARTSSSLSG